MKHAKHLLSFLLLILFTCFFTGCGSSSLSKAEKTIKNELDLLKNLDSDTTQKYISYKELFPGSTEENPTISPDIQEVFSLFFQDFDYKILDIESAGKNTASARLKLITPDAKSLAKDYYSALLESRILQASESEFQNTEDIDFTLEKRYLLLSQLLKNKSYENVTTECAISLNYSPDTNEWEIKRTESLENDLVGGLLSYLSDYYILTPEDTLSIYFDTLKEMDPVQMSNFLGVDSILNTGDTDKSKIASALVSKVHSIFNYEITDCTIHGYTANITTKITTFDSDAILAHYEEELNEYLSSPEAVIDGSSKRYTTCYEMLLDCIESIDVSTISTAKFTLENDGISWNLQDDSQELGNAIFGTLTVSPVYEE